MRHAARAVLVAAALRAWRRDVVSLLVILSPAVRLVV